ncbi:hypothetical protein PUNSTDRAFT_49814 [Punctularia strigosozonata HHB-11173 SS5]|uniref:uncharacterized protein n=1 Tax=Punctularia strigosozonata (strain HHB-11173) TaxID=741275 RepID=UPI0004417BB1|nr:uncharacterized protein PUNSTDRAFT_49814 [Punctularia strigosozonata HHB-11173 SS5]EIN12515.1 hypothetical protein PUNSTDRAFT_49814 [Punctularia strigosozonata HHB-11173 SS5]
MRAASGGFGNGNGGGRSSRGQGGGGGGMGGGSGSGSGSGGDGGDRRGASGSFLDTDSDTSESESGSDSEDEAGGRKKGGSTTSDDDVPLAQKIPTALKAQKTIRRQVRAEREERKRKKLLERAESQAQKAYLAHGPSMHRERNETLRPSANPRTSGSPPRQTSGASPHLPSMAGVVQQAVAADAARRMAALSLNNGPGDLSSSSSSSPPHIPRRTRAQTLTGGSSRPYAQPAPMPVPAMPVPVPQTPHRGASLQPRASTSRPGSPTRSGGWARAMRGLRQHSPNPPSVPPSPVIPSSPNPGHRRQPSVERERQREPSGLRPMRSFHRPSRSQNVTPPEGSPQMAQLQRSRSRAGRSSDERARRPSTSDGHHRPPVPPLPPQPPSRHSEQPPVPGRASVEHMPPAVLRQGPMVQQKIFVGDLQRFHTVELGPSTSAAEALETIQKTGALDGWVGSGSWLVFEVAQDFGMERPVREYEQLMDVIGSWNKEKSTNLLLVKKTPLASVLSRSALPTSSPTHGGYVEWESKRGKWNKRWLHLREHGLWLSKKDSSRDDQFLCSLSNFDVYAVTRQHKSPKPFVFAVKSTEPLSFFENTADYNHFFSCSDKDGPLWVQKILLARSYVLYQERNVLFSKSSSSGSTTGNQGGLARSGTRKRPAEPLVTVSAPFSATVAAASAAVFEPGSLLAKQ